MAWNHNTHYHRVLLDAVPPGAARALDVGCGLGRFARELAGIVPDVLAIDRDAAAVARARTELAGTRAGTRIEVREADFLATPLVGFDVVTMIAVLHHMPLAEALAHAAGALSPGGVLAVIGLARDASIVDFAASAISFPMSQVLRRTRAHAEVGAPIHDPAETLAQIREVAMRVLPGVVITRRLLWRYTLVWTKP